MRPHRIWWSYRVLHSFFAFGAIAGFAATFLISCVPRGSERSGAMKLTQAVDQIRPTIVQISFVATGLSEEVRRQVGRPFVIFSLGTGFLVNPDGYAITARHVIQGGREILKQMQAGQKRILVGLAQPNTENMRGNFNLVDFDLVDEDDQHDLALLKLKQNPFKGEVRSGIVIGGQEVPLLFGIPTLSLSRPKDGEAIGISGYPLGEPVLVTNAGWMATSWSFEIADVPVPGAPEWFRRPEIADAYLADVEVNRGNSGGPVYLIETAAVVGVAVGSRPAPVRDRQGNNVSIKGRELVYSSGLTIVVPTRYVTDLLRKHNLKWSESMN